VKTKEIENKIGFIEVYQSWMKEFNLIKSVQLLVEKTTHFEDSNNSFRYAATNGFYCYNNFAKVSLK